MSRVYVGNLDPRVNERDLEDEFRMFGVLRRYLSALISFFFVVNIVFCFRILGIDRVVWYDTVVYYRLFDRISNQ